LLIDIEGELKKCGS